MDWIEAAAGALNLTPAKFVEYAAALLGVANVVLVVRRSIWNYPFALAMVTLYLFVFWDARLYSDALLQIFFFVLNVYGLANWLRSRREAGEVVVTVLSGRERALWLAGTLAASLAWGWVMMRFTDAAAPVWDALIAGMSVSAQLLLARRRLENWVLWIAVDVIAIPLYWSRGLGPTAFLYLLFLGLAVAGLVSWWRAYRRGAARAA
ncbi:MAG TPA: nicotinamide riboside transporter PnuC [Allosphingosinicella sp.]|nr:nicotinamide riboside transporter PnuC [Allosphingosinicella sp.]